MALIPRVHVGKHPTTLEPGMWISKPGFNALTETNPDNMLFDPTKYLVRPYLRGTPLSFAKGAYYISQQNQLQSGTIVWVRYYRYELVVVHGLGYVPVFTTELGGILAEPWADANSYNVKARGNPSFQYTVGDGTYWTTSAPGTGTAHSTYEADANFFVYNRTTGRLEVAPSKIGEGNFAIYRNRAF